MIAKVFKSALKPFMEPLTLGDYEKAADAIATAYDISNIGMSMTIFGSILLKGNKEILKSFLLQGLTLNSNLVSYLPVVEPGWTTMATGFCMYWSTATFTPMPPLPPMVSPLLGTQVIFPGTPTGLDIALKVAFTQGDLDKCLDILSLSLIAHQLTITGTYNGLVAAAPSPLPLILPWVAIIGVPDVSIKSDDEEQTDTTQEDGGGQEDVVDDNISDADKKLIDDAKKKLDDITIIVSDLKKLNVDDLQNKDEDILLLLGDVNILSSNAVIIASSQYPRVIYLLAELRGLLNKINQTPSVSEERFPYSGECIECE